MTWWMKISLTGTCICIECNMMRRVFFTHRVSSLGSASISALKLISLSERMFLYIVSLGKTDQESTSSFLLSFLYRANVRSTCPRQDICYTFVWIVSCLRILMPALLNLNYSWQCLEFLWSSIFLLISSLCSHCCCLFASAFCVFGELVIFSASRCESAPMGANSVVFFVTKVYLLPISDDPSFWCSESQ